MCLNGIFGVAPQRLNDDVLLNPLEKDFYVPSVTIDVDEFNDCEKHEHYDQIQKKLAANAEQTNSGTLEDAEENQSATKILRDGQIRILRGDKTFTISGQELK